MRSWVNSFDLTLDSKNEGIKYSSDFLMSIDGCPISWSISNRRVFISSMDKSEIPNDSFRTISNSSLIQSTISGIRLNRFFHLCDLVSKIQTTIEAK